MAQQSDVVIVGAGASGLRLAGLLHRVGISAVVLEARDRIGGRLLTVEPGVDLGATWFWQHESDVLDVIAETGLETFPQHVQGNMMYQAPGTVQEMDGNPLDQQAWRVVGGMQKLAAGLARALPIDTLKLSTKVTGVQFGEMVTVSTDQGTWQAKHVVLALPPATALANISFSPELPADLVAVASKTPVWMGAITKAIALYETPFWRLKGLAGSAMSHVGPLREIHDIGDFEGTFGALFGFTRDRNVTEAAVTAQLGELYGGDALSPTSVLIEDWSASEHTSPPAVFELNEYQLFGAKELRESYFDGQLYFASTETATSSPGHIQGALSAAKRTAAAITALLP